MKLEKITPISPSQAADISFVPDMVLKSFNKILAERFSGKGQVTIKQSEVTMLIIIEMKKSCQYPKDVTTIHLENIIFEKHWLDDIEPLYKKVGWHVTYKKASRGDDFEPYFAFTPIT